MSSSLTESRLPPMLALLAAAALLASVPAQLRFLPFWVSGLAIGCMLAAMAAVAASGGALHWLRLERAIVLLTAGGYAGAIGAALGDMVGVITLRPSAVNPFLLLSSAAVIWLGNVLIFGLLYWQIDRGGPAARAAKRPRRPDWMFPRPDAPDDLPPGWRPLFVDYLYLAFNTATAFSPTDALPLTRRAKLLMMAESALSLVTTLVLLSHAINALPG